MSDAEFVFVNGIKMRPLFYEDLDERIDAEIRRTDAGFNSGDSGACSGKQIVIPNKTPEEQAHRLFLIGEVQKRLGRDLVGPDLQPGCHPQYRLSVATECFNWLDKNGAICADQNKYRSIVVPLTPGGKPESVRVIRLVLALNYGEIGAGETANHICRDRRSCARISHLYIGTQKQNRQDDADVIGSSVKRYECHDALMLLALIYARGKDGRRFVQKDLAERAGMHVSHLSNIKSGHRHEQAKVIWKTLDRDARIELYRQAKEKWNIE